MDFKMTSEVDGGIRAKQKVNTDTTKLGEGSFGDVNWTNTRTMNTYKDSDIDFDVGVVRENAVWRFDGMEYSSTNTRDVDLGGGLEHKPVKTFADGRVDISMDTKHSEEAKLSQGNSDIEQVRRTGHSLDGDWKDTNGRALTGGQYTHFQEDRQTVKEKHDDGRTIYKRSEDSRSKIGVEKGKTGYSVDLQHSVGGAKSMDRQLVDEHGVAHSDQLMESFPPRVVLREIKMATSRLHLRAMQPEVSLKVVRNKPMRGQRNAGHFWFRKCPARFCDV